MILFDAMREAKEGDILVNEELGASFEWTGTVWCVPGKFYNFSFPGWKIIKSSMGVKMETAKTDVWAVVELMGHLTLAGRVR